MPNKVYDFLKQNNLTSKTEQDFETEYSDPKKSAGLHAFMSNNGLTTKTKDEFYSEYFNGGVKKKEETAQSEPYGSDSKTPSPLSEKSGEDKSFTERIATNDLPQTFAKQQTKGKSDSEILAEKKSQTQIAQEAHRKVRLDAMSEQKPLLDGISEYAETVKVAIQKGWKQGELASKINEVASAQANAKMAKDFDFTPESYQKVYDEKVTQLGDIQKSIESIQSSKSVKKYEEANNNQEAWEAFKENPIDIITNLALSSASSLFSNTLNSKSEGDNPVLGNILQAPAPTVPLLMAEKSYQLGMSSDVIGALQDSGVDLKDPKSIKSAIEDDKKMAEIYSNARKRNIPIAIVDAVTGSIASKVTKSIPRKAIGVLAGLGVEATGGAIGESLGRKNAGQEFDAKAMLEEAAGEAGAGAPNVASSFIKTRGGGVQVQEPTQQSTTNTEGAQPSDAITQQQESVVQPTSPKTNQGATIKSAIIEVGGQTFEGKNHAEAILKAKQAGKDVSQVDRESEGMFKLSDGSEISREEAKATFGADKSEILIPQDDNSNEANKEYERIKREQVGQESLAKVEVRDIDFIINIPVADTPDMVAARLSPPKEDAVIQPEGNQGNNPIAIQETGATGTQEQEGTNGVQAVSENVQETGTPNAEGVPISQEGEKINTVGSGVVDSPALKDVKIKYGGKDKDLKVNPQMQWMKPKETSEQATNRLAGFVEASDYKGREQSAFIDIKGESTEVKLRNDDGKWNWYEPKSKKPFASFDTAKDAIKYIQEQPFWDNGQLNKNGRNDTYFAKVKSEQIKSELENGNILEDINDGKISAEDAKGIIESAGLKIPKEIESLLSKEQPKVDSPALKDIESTTKALGKLNKETIINLGDGGDLERFAETLSISDKKDWDRLQELEFDKTANKKEVQTLRDKFKPLEQAYFSQNYPTPESVSKAYHKAKPDGSYPELVTAVESLLGERNNLTNEPTQEPNVPISVLDQPRATDSNTEKGTEQVEKNEKQKEYKFNKRQRLGIPVNEAMQQLAEKDKANSVYSVTTNKELLAEANKRIEKDIDEAYEFATQDDPKASEVKGMFATAGRLIPILENAIKNADSADAKAFWIDKLDFLRKYTQELAKTSGQSVQALVTVGNIMPMRDSIELIAIAQREAFIKNGTKDGKFEESVKNGVKEDAEKVADNIINNDSKVKELEAKIIELEGKIAGKKKAKRDEAEKKAIEKIDSILGQNFAFSDPLLVANAVQKGAVVLKTLIKGKNKVADAIDKAVAHINTLTKGVKWDEAKFRATVNDQLSDVRETLDELYDEKQATVKSRKQLKDSIRKGLISGDFSDLETLLKSKEMDEDGIDNYVNKLKRKHEDEVVFAVYKRVQKNIGLTPSIKRVKSAVEMDVAKEPLTDVEAEVKLKKQIDAVSKEVEKLKANRIEKNTASKEELEAKKKLEELERSKKDLTNSQLAKKILDSEPLTEQEIISRLKKKKDALDKKIVDERAKRIKKNLETTAEKQDRQEKAKVEQSMKELSDVQIAKRMVSQEPLTPEEVEALFKKKHNLEDITPEQSEKLKELYDEVERVSGDVDLKKEALDKLRHEAQKLVPKTGWSAFMNAYDSIWHYPSILSGHMTQIANYADALMQSFTPDMISKTGRESFKDQFKGLKSAVNKAKIGLREGFLSEGLLNNRQPDKLNLSRKTAEDFAREGNKIAKATKWVGRVMSLPNTFGEAIKFNALSNIIQRDLTAQGLTGRALKDRKNELLFGTAAKMPEYEAKAVEMVYGKEQRDGKDVLKEAKVKRTISNLILEDMQKQMTTIEGQNAIETAERIKDIATYQNDATGLISILPRFISSLESNRTFGEAIKFINKKALRIDFLNTIANIANSKLNYLPPYGYLRANNISTSRIIKWAKPEWEGMLSHPDYSKPENSEEKRRILQKANIGTMIVVGASAMAISGAIKDEDDDKNEHRFITGDLTPSDIMDMASKHVHKKEAYESVPPNSIKLPVFGWTNYMLTPFAGALAMVGNLSDRMYANKHKELTKESIMADVMWAEARALKSIILDGTPLGAIIESNKPSKMTTTDNALQQIAVWGMTKTADIVGSSIPNLVKSIGKQIDPTLYTPKDLPTIIVKQMGLLNWYSAIGGELKTGYAVDILGNKIGTKSGDRYFNLLLEDHPEDKKIYDLLLAAYKEPMNYPALLSSNMAIRVELINKEEYDKKLGIIKTKFEKGSLSQVQMQNQLDALEKASKKDDDIGNYPLLYSQALEFSGSEFKKMLKENYNDISNTKNSNEKQNKINTLLSTAKDLAKSKYGVPPKRAKNKL